MVVIGATIALVITTVNSDVEDGKRLTLNVRRKEMRFGWLEWSDLTNPVSRRELAAHWVARYRPVSNINFASTSVCHSNYIHHHEISPSACDIQSPCSLLAR